MIYYSTRCTHQHLWSPDKFKATNPFSHTNHIFNDVGDFMIHWELEIKMKKGKIKSMSLSLKVYSSAYHSGPNQILYGLLNLFHVNPSSKVHVLIKEITMPVLFSCPRPRPNSPSGWTCTDRKSVV